MALQVRAHVGARWHHGQALAPRVGQCELRQGRGDAATLELGQHLGVHECDPTTLDDVLEDAHQLALAARLIATRLGDVDDLQVHGLDGSGGG